MNALRWIMAVFAFLFGSVFASFAGVVAYRVPKQQSIVTPGSYCPGCKKELSWYENIPVFAYLLQRGRCRSCKHPIGFFSFLLELFGGLFFLLAYLQFGTLHYLPEFLLMLAILFLFLVMAAIDYETHDIYNSTLILFAVLSAGMVACRVLRQGGDVWDHVLGLVLGFAFFGSVKIVAKLVLKREAMGSGDVYLIGIGGFLVGAIPLLFSIIIATVSGSVIELIRIKSGKTDAAQEIAFGPYLLLGIAAMALYGPQIMTLYWEVLL